MARRQLARGFRGGESSRGLLQVDMQFPTAVRLTIDGEALKRAIGNRIALVVRRRLLQGLDGDGSPLPLPQPKRKWEPSRAPLNATGSLIRSIRYDPRVGYVLPNYFPRSQGVSKRARSNFGLMAIQIAGVFTRRGQPQSSDRPPLVDPMGSESPGTITEIERVAERELRRQESAGKLGLVLELEKRARIARQRARRGR